MLKIYKNFATFLTPIALVLFTKIKKTEIFRRSPRLFVDI